VRGSKVRYRKLPFFDFFRQNCTIEQELPYRLFKKVPTNGVETE
jgi:hypothetical protein